MLPWQSTKYIIRLFSSLAWQFLIQIMFNFIELDKYYPSLLDKLIDWYIIFKKFLSKFHLPCNVLNISHKHDYYYRDNNWNIWIRRFDGNQPFAMKIIISYYAIINYPWQSIEYHSWIWLFLSWQSTKYIIGLFFIFAMAIINYFDMHQSSLICMRI